MQAKIANEALVEDKSKYCEPAQSVIKVCGGVVAASKITGRHVTNVHRWRLPKEQGGGGGIVPGPVIPILTRWAKENGKELDFYKALSTEAENV